MKRQNVVKCVSAAERIFLTRLLSTVGSGIHHSCAIHQATKAHTVMWSQGLIKILEQSGGLKNGIHSGTAVGKARSAGAGQRRRGKKEAGRMEGRGKEQRGRRKEGRSQARREREETRGALSPAVRGCTAKLCCPQQPSSVSTATQFATELIGSLMSQERC